ncbi:hypothetical protein [Micromonospora sp. MH99]|uniref:hypothetical protein n=1 Tax=Micromonospora sp. MH99 TaxID=1945510 RepID=UPI001F1FC394|nr:hypothetical protein [Micromonospora sp. MH99]MCF0091330.1 hypothetical protein [Micromonospora sp. MH99]
MPERPVARDDAATEQPSPLELSREPHDGARDAYDAHDALDDAGDHESHDPYQPL